MASVRMVPVYETNREVDARMVAARLGAEGILYELRGIDSAYPGTTMISVLVPDDEAEAAREMLMWDDLQADGAGPVINTDTPVALWLVLLVIVGSALFTLARAMGAGY